MAGGDRLHNIVDMYTTELYIKMIKWYILCYVHFYHNVKIVV